MMGYLLNGRALHTGTARRSVYTRAYRSRMCRTSLSASSYPYKVSESEV